MKKNIYVCWTEYLNRYRNDFTNQERKLEKLITDKARLYSRIRLGLAVLLIINFFCCLFFAWSGYLDRRTLFFCCLVFFAVFFTLNALKRRQTAAVAAQRALFEASESYRFWKSVWDKDDFTDHFTAVAVKAGCPRRETEDLIGNFTDHAEIYGENFYLFCHRRQTEELARKQTEMI